MAVQYDQEHFLVTFGGNTVGGHEQWQCGLRFDGHGALPDVVVEAGFNAVSVEDIYHEVALLIQNGMSGARYDQHTSLEFAKLAWIKTDGNYKTDAREYRSHTVGQMTTTMTTPPQLAVAVSLWSGTKIGHANRGRFFLPMPNEWASAVDATSGMVYQAGVLALTGLVQPMLESIKGEVATVQVPAQLSIFSPKTPKSVAVLTPSHKHVTKMGIGRTIDTQRSRRRSLPEGITVWTDLDLSG